MSDMFTQMEQQEQASLAKMTPEKAAVITREAALILADHDYLKGANLLLLTAKWLETLNISQEVSGC